MSNVQSKKMTPQIRFKNFLDEWSQKKYTETFETSVSNNTLSRSELTTEKTSTQNVHYGDVLIKFDSVLDVKKNEIPYIPEDAKIDSKNLLKNGDIVFADTAEDETCGKATEINNIDNEKLVAGLHTFVARPKVNFVPKYLGYFINSPAYHNQLLPFMQGTKVTSISKTSIQKTWINYPASIEQSKIGELFSQIDYLIASTKKEHDKFVALKKCMLQKMFPKKGTLVPEIRFKGFSGDWEETSAENIFITTNDRNHAGLPVLSASQEFGMIYRDEGGMNISHDKANEVTYKRVLPGQFVIHLRSFQGGFAHSKVEGITSPAYTIMDFSDKAKHDDYFWKYIFSSTEFINRLELITYGIRDGRSINFSDFSKLTFFIPNKREQEKIGTYFRNLDSLIYKQKDELEKLKNVKKTLLSKMFV